MLKEQVAEIVDNILACDALIVLDLDKDKVANIINWSNKRQEAHYTLRNTSIDQILNLYKARFKEIVDKLTVIDTNKALRQAQLDAGYTYTSPFNSVQEWDIIAKAQLQHTKKQLLDLMGE